MTQARIEVFVVALQTLEQSPPPPMLIGSWQDVSSGQLVAVYAVATSAQVVAKRIVQNGTKSPETAEAPIQC